MRFPILFHDDYLVAINKPSGLLVHRSNIDKYETRFAVQLLRDQLGRRVYPIHRLDKPTSGVLLFAFDAHITRMVAADWGNVEKRYLVMSRGRLVSQALSHPVRSMSESDKIKVQDARTNFKCLATARLPVVFGKRAEGYTHTTFSLVEAMLQTGRKHQIRKHLKHLNHPIVGDTRYGRGEINRYFREHYRLNRLLLHCHMMRLMHPVTGKNVILYAPLDSDWGRVLGRLPWGFNDN